MILETLIVVALVFSASLWLTSRLSSPASRWRLLDHPNERSLHAEPIPRTGGLAILLSLAFGLILEGARVLLGASHVRVPAMASLWIIGMVVLIAGVSLWDDWTELPPFARLAVHALATGGVVIGAGLSYSNIPVPLLGQVPLSWLAVPLTMLCLMWMTNLYNFMDGMDGFAGGMAVVGFGFLGYLSWRGGNLFIALLSLLTVSAAGGFLLYNRPPAKIFMGDVGSILLGFLAGALSLMGVSFKLFEFWVPVLIFSPFIVDATVTLLRRLLRREKIWQAHRQHYYQRLVLLGWSHRKTVLAEYCLMIACGASAIIYQRAGESARCGLLLAWALIYALLALSVRAAEHKNWSNRVSL